jgi:serine/threonine protein kinase
MRNFQLGQLLGNGSCGQVYSLLQQDGTPTVFTIKCVPKARFVNMRAIIDMAEQIELMKLLSDVWAHPNIVALQCIYHSKTHLLFQLEYGGPLDLFCYLEGHEQQQLEVPIHKTKAIFSQSISAISHLHSIAKVAHRDIKPENMIVSTCQIEDTVNIKVADFDTAVLECETASSGVIGTFPYMAPEVWFDTTYLPCAADIWSIAIVFVEVLCRTRILEQELGLVTGTRSFSRPQIHALRERMAHRIRHHFSQRGAVAYLLRRNMRAEVRPLMRDLVELLDRMLQVVVDRRLCAEDISAASNVLFRS